MRERDQGRMEGMRIALAMLENEIKLARNAKKHHLAKALGRVLGQLQAVKHVQRQAYAVNHEDQQG